MTKRKSLMKDKDRKIYNEGVRDALKEVWLYDGTIPSATEREALVRNVQKKVSYKVPKFKPLVLR